MRPDEKFKEFFFHPSFSSLFYYACYEERDTVRFYSLYYFFFIIFLDKNSRQIVRKRIFFFPLIFLYIYMYYSFSFLFVSHSTRARDTTLSYFFFFFYTFHSSTLHFSYALYALHSTRKQDFFYFHSSFFIYIFMYRHAEKDTIGIILKNNDSPTLFSHFCLWLSTGIPRTPETEQIPMRSLQMRQKSWIFWRSLRELIVQLIIKEGLRI